MLAFFLAFCLAFYLAFHLAVGPLSWEGPQLRPSGVHWGRELALELKSSGAHWDQELVRRSCGEEELWRGGACEEEEEEEEDRRGVELCLKSDNPHLAGGKKRKNNRNKIMIIMKIFAMSHKDHGVDECGDDGIYKSDYFLW